MLYLHPKMIALAYHFGNLILADSYLPNTCTPFLVPYPAMHEKRAPFMQTGTAAQKPCMIGCFHHAAPSRIGWIGFYFSTGPPFPSFLPLLPSLN